MAKISFSKATRAGKGRRGLVSGLVVTAAALAASLLVSSAATRPAEAAFPDPAGAIA